MAESPGDDIFGSLTIILPAPVVLKLLVAASPQPPPKIRRHPSLDRRAGSHSRVHPSRCSTPLWTVTADSFPGRGQPARGDGVGAAKSRQRAQSPATWAAPSSAAVPAFKVKRAHCTAEELQAGHPPSRIIPGSDVISRSTPSNVTSPAEQKSAKGLRHSAHLVTSICRTPSNSSPWPRVPDDKMWINTSRCINRPGSLPGRAQIRGFFFPLYILFKNTQVTWLTGSRIMKFSYAASCMPHRCNSPARNILRAIKSRWKVLNIPPLFCNTTSIHTHWMQTFQFKTYWCMT